VTVEFFKTVFVLYQQNSEFGVSGKFISAALSLEIEISGSV